MSIGRCSVSCRLTIARKLLITMAAPSKKMTKEEEATARAARKASGKEMKKEAPGEARPAPARATGAHDPRG